MAYTELALSTSSIADELNASGFSTRPILAIWFPVMKSGFWSSFSIQEYTKTLNAPSSL
jgi:hypothetical protein